MEAYGRKIDFDPQTDPIVRVMRSLTFGKLGRDGEAKTALADQLGLEPDFTVKGRTLIGNYVKVDDLVDKIVEGLQYIGLGNLK